MSQRLNTVEALLCIWLRRWYILFPLGKRIQKADNLWSHDYLITVEHQNIKVDSRNKSFTYDMSPGHKVNQLY